LGVSFVPTGPLRIGGKRGFRGAPTDGFGFLLASEVFKFL